MDVGIGTTGLCNLTCPHCYSRKYDGKFISLNDMERLLEVVEISSVNFGTGENILNPDFRAILRLLHSHDVKMSLTTNGFTVSQLENEYLAMFHDIDFSLEFPDQVSQDTYRGAGTWNSVSKGLERCKALSIPTSIACVLMRPNAHSLLGFRKLMKNFNCLLRINVIKCGDFLRGDKEYYSLKYDVFWNTFIDLFHEFRLISCSEPILCVAIDMENSSNGSPCGKESIRIQPNGSILPCVYWPEEIANIHDDGFRFDLLHNAGGFDEISTIPTFCFSCVYINSCRGGCASRRKLSGGINTPDEFCPIYRGLEFPNIKVSFSKNRFDLVHSSYLCTIIFGAED